MLVNTIVQLFCSNSNGLIASVRQERQSPSLIGIEDEMSQRQTGLTRERSENQIPICAKLITLAQRELAAFLSAVVCLFGSEQATLAADIWLDELMSVENLTGFSSRDWRLITVGAISRLAHHLVNIRKDRKSCVADVETLASTPRD